MIVIIYLASLRRVKLEVKAQLELLKYMKNFERR